MKGSCLPTTPSKQSGGDRPAVPGVDRNGEEAAPAAPQTRGHRAPVLPLRAQADAARVAPPAPRSDDHTEAGFTRSHGYFVLKGPTFLQVFQPAASAGRGGMCKPHEGLLRLGLFSLAPERHKVTHPQCVQVEFGFAPSMPNTPGSIRHLVTSINSLSHNRHRSDLGSKHPGFILTATLRVFYSISGSRFHLSPTHKLDREDA